MYSSSAIEKWWSLRDPLRELPASLCVYFRSRERKRVARVSFLTSCMCGRQRRSSDGLRDGSCVDDREERLEGPSVGCARLPTAFDAVRDGVRDGLDVSAPRDGVDVSARGARGALGEGVADPTDVLPRDMGVVMAFDDCANGPAPRALPITMRPVAADVQPLSPRAARPSDLIIVLQSTAKNKGYLAFF